MNVLLLPVGSHGDVHPFVGLGRRLAGRGHGVTMLTNGHFAGLARRAGLEFVELGGEEDYQRATSNPDLWHATRALPTVMQMVRRLIRPMYDAIAERWEPGKTLVVAGTLAFGARVAQDKLGVPVVSVHLQPSILRTLYDWPVLPGPPMPRRAPKWFKRLVCWAADWAVADRVMATPVNEVRAELGLPKVRRILNGWIHSPLRTIGLFPEWFAPGQPDWPAQLRVTGFPMFDEGELRREEHGQACADSSLPVPPTLRQFLDAGEAPIVFTPGSAMRHDREFFGAAVGACERLGRRGLLLTRFAEHLPERLPEGVRRFEYVPFGQVLPRCAAIAHHGGVGTVAQAFAAGIPQVVIPLAHDQFDNAARVERLGAGKTVAARRLDAGRAAAALGTMLGDARVAGRCRELAARFAGVDALGETCDLIEATMDTCARR